ncbi:terminase small subunit [Alkaliphilus sp. B6464]|uniref:terminase small subunit n=1 Tax=Alkaliphilus sp. B6464 TaxID=2731219 RepID=UPI001BAE3188|nr:terminase small subunit [Alkaliphilus sp. B6464]QUH21430.1 terminase small subunit [Alkaliphilus sp. B6464]
MTEIRGPDYELAEKDYMLGMKYKDIAEKYNVSINTVKSWKQRYNWSRKGVHTKSKRVHTQKESAISKEIIKKAMNDDEIEDAELTDKQHLFCMYYVKYWNATKAYQKAYDSNYLTARVEGSRNLAKPNIKKEIDKLKQSIREGIGLDAMAVLQKYMDIAFADITDYVEFGKKPVVVGIVDGEPKELVLNYVDLNDSVNVDGSLISEVKQGKEGISIKLHDKMKALEKLEKYFDLFPDRFRRQIEEEKIKMAREKLELEKTKVLGEDEEVEDDGFIEALKGEVSEVWDDAEED